MHVLVIIVNIDNMHGEKLKKKKSKEVKLVAITKRYNNTGEIANRHVRYIPQGIQGTEPKSERVIQ